MVRTSVEEFARSGLRAARGTGEVVAGSLREAGRELVFAEVAAHRAGLLQEAELGAALDVLGTVAALTARVRLRVACDVAERGLHVAAGFTLVDWLALRCPDLSGEAVRDLARVAGASRQGVHRPLVDAVACGRVSVSRAAGIHRALARIRGAITPQEYGQAVDLLVGAAGNPVFDDRDVARVVAALLRACLPEREHEGRARAQRELRDVHESNLADGSVRRMIVTFGDDADYEAVRAVLVSPLSAPASRQEQHATGVVESRTAGQRRYDALMTVLRRGIAGTRGQPTTPKATLVVTMDLDTLRRDITAASGGAHAGRGGVDAGRGGVHAGGGATGQGVARGGVARTGRAPGCGATLEGASISAATIRVLACEADVIPMVLGGPSEVVDQGRRRRLVTPGQRVRLAARDRGCTIPGCTVPATWCDAHHVIPWYRGGRSDLSNYALLCQRHHTWVHDHDLSATVDGLGVTWHLR